MIKHINPKNNPYTSITGFMFIAVAIVMFLAPLFVEIKTELNYWIPAWIGIIGLSLLLVPDYFIVVLKTFITKFFARKADEL